MVKAAEMVVNSDGSSSSIRYYYYYYYYYYHYYLSLLEFIDEEVGEEEMAQMVNTKLCLKPIRCQFVRACHHLFGDRRREEGGRRREEEEGSINPSIDHHHRTVSVF